MPNKLKPEIEVKPAVNVEGHLLYLHGLNKYVFRVYTFKNGSVFMDYDISHSDLLLKITDEDASFFTNKSTGAATLDHCPEC